MTEADRADYARQFEQARKRLPRGHVINHAKWQDGRLTVESAPPERPAATAADQPRVRRGLNQQDLFGQP